MGLIKGIIITQAINCLPITKCSDGTKRADKQGFLEKNEAGASDTGAFPSWTDCAK